MATMIPGDIGEFDTEGEKAFYKFLEGVAKPDAHYLCWYLPEVNGKEPDFLLYSDEVGLIIFEVKDWALKQIEEANPHHFLIQIKGKTESRKIPSSRPMTTSFRLKTRSKRMEISSRKN